MILSWAWGKGSSRKWGFEESCCFSILSLACCSRWPADPGCFLILPNAEFNKAYEIFQGLELARERLSPGGNVRCLVLLFSLLNTLISRSQCLLYKSGSEINAEDSNIRHGAWVILPGLFFSKSSANHSKRHTLYRCVHMHWIWYIYKFTTLGTKKFTVLFPPSLLIMSKLVLTGLSYLVKVLLALGKLTLQDLQIM